MNQFTFDRADVQRNEHFAEMTDNASSEACAEQPIPEKLPMQSKRGYCACCQELYNCLEQHLQSTRHKQSAGESRNQLVAKSLMERFLQDVIQYHPSRYKDNRPTYMDLPSVSAPLIPRKELADIHSYQDDKETVGTREELPSTDNESVQSAHAFGGKNIADCRQTRDTNVPSVPVGHPTSSKVTGVGEPASEEQVEVSLPSFKGLCRTTFLNANEGMLSCGKAERHGSRIALALYKPASRRGIRDYSKPKVICSHEDHGHWNPTSQVSLPDVSSGQAFKFSKLHQVNSQGTMAGSPLPQLRDHGEGRSLHCPAGPSQQEEFHSSNVLAHGDRLTEGEAAAQAKDLVLETIETVIQKYCTRQASQPRDSDSEDSADGKHQHRGEKVQGSPQAKKAPLEKEYCTLSNSYKMACSKQVLQETASCFKKMLSLTLSCENKSGGQHQGTGEDVESSGGSICSLGSQLGQLKSSSSSEWNASVKMEKRSSRVPVRDLELMTDARISLDDHGYKTQLSSVLRSQEEECDKMEIENVSPAESSRKAEPAEEKPRPLEPEQRLQSLPYVPPSFAGKTWSEIMAEDDLKVEALVKEFKEGRYLCYFDSESLANYGRKQKKPHRAGVKDALKGTSQVSADSHPNVPSPEALPHLRDDDGDDDRDDELPPALCPASVGKKPALRHCRLASRCQIVKVSHGTQTSEVSYPVVKKKSRRLDQEPENFWSGLEQAERPDTKTRLCSLRLPRSYSRIMSPVQPRTVIYVLSSPDFDSLEGKRSSRTLQEGASPTKYRYKKSPVRYYDPVTNRILKMPPSSLAPSHHVRQLFRNLSPDINMGLPTDEHRTPAKLQTKAGGSCGLLQAGNSAASGSRLPATALKARDRGLGEAPSSDCPSKSTGSWSDGASLPLPQVQSDQKSLVLSPLGADGPNPPSSRLNVYTGPRSRHVPEEENPDAVSETDSPPLYNLRDASSCSHVGTPPAAAVSPCSPPRLRSSLRRPAGKDSSLGEKVLRREARSGEVAARDRASYRRSQRQVPRRRK
ncbi:DBF4-type zinc finger-containing protein 2 isoform X2 [Hypanus sabinus]|uniref:DBF4-type zinc finger-containing protein 2 isoform X2 n=1 Tax=Hypanus sabinus TaxID=79690 RepID=UPI0028C41C4E|nr:DBF4-type zinc finger-containing protein 2 isoform X2 [Hypanus sabinus]